MRSTNRRLRHLSLEKFWTCQKVPGTWPVCFLRLANWLKAQKYINKQKFLILFHSKWPHGHVQSRQKVYSLSLFCCGGCVVLCCAPLAALSLRLVLSLDFSCTCGGLVFTVAISPPSISWSCKRAGKCVQLCKRESKRGFGYNLRQFK